jgi:Tol biopolymer transport system component
MGVRRAEGFVKRLARTLRLGVHRASRPAAAGVLALLLVPGTDTQVRAQTAGAVDLASIGLSGSAGNGASSGVAVNTDDNFVVFYSDASNLVAADTNNARDIFVRDMGAQTTERVSVSSTGAQANQASHATGGAPAISGDGQIVAFYSAATNLVAGDTNHQPDVFVRSRAAATTERVSVATDGTEGNGPSVAPSISADGRFVAFQSQASNLVPDDTNHAADVFVHDRSNGTTERVCGSVQGDRFSFSPSISRDGNFVAFASAATNLVPGDTNGRLDIFVCNRSSGTIERVSVSSSGVQGDGDSILPAISANGNFVAFKSLSTNLVANDNNGVVDVFVYDRAAGTTERISVDVNGQDADDFSFPPSISDDGRFVAFGSYATNLAAGDNNHTSNVFVRDRTIGKTLLVDVGNRGQLGNGGTPDIPPSVSGDGLAIGFVSLASNLAVNDRNDQADVYVAQNPFFGPAGFTPTPKPTGTPTPTPTVTVTPTRTLSPTFTPTFPPCMTDADCEPFGKICRGGTCKIPRPCNDDDPAVDRLACFGDRETCIDGLCECGGDCNLDGFVFGNEINKAVAILNDVLPLAQCTAADINGDGQVMGNEITLAVLNLGEGCPQEGRPLIFAHDRGGMVTLTVSSTSGTAGESATVSVDVSGGNGEVATAQIDLLFDPTTLEIGNVGAACIKDPRLTEHMLSASLPDTPPAPSGLQRLRLFVGDITAPIATFGDGRVATCTFQIKPGAPGTATVVAGDRLNVGDARGDVFGSQAVSGGVSILLPTPTPVPVPTPRPFCAGDCNGDGEVFVNEITLAVRILAGEAPLADCPAADADGDGEVFVTDITRAVVSLGFGCPQ